MASCQHFRHFALDDLARQAFGDGGLADAGIADQQRVVLAPAAQHLDACARPRASRPISGSTSPLRALALRSTQYLASARFLAVAFGGLRLFLQSVAPVHRAGFAEGRVLGDAVGDEVDRVVAGHVLFLHAPSVR